MRYYIPTEVFFEKDCVRNHGAELARYGKKCLIVTGRNSSRRNGALQDVADTLKQAGIRYEIFDQIEENPSIETVMEARKAGLLAQAEFVVGIGGGSPLDAAKAIALMIANPDADESVLYQKTELPALPVVAVPTTAGTGSEATPYSILTIHKEQTKRSIAHKIFPALALADAKYLTFAPRNVIVNTAVDTLAHLIESNLNANADAYNRIFSEQGMVRWAKTKDSLMSGELTETDYENLMIASTIGGMAISHTSTSLPHGLSYMLTYHFGTPHGKAVGVFLPGYLRFCAGKDMAAAGNVLALLGFSDLNAFEEWIFKLLGEVTIPADMWKQNVELILRNPAKLSNVPYPVGRDEISAMYRTQS